MKYLGIDLGTKTVGIAISDKTGLIASSYKNIKYTNDNQLLKDIKDIVNKEAITHLVLGLPKNMNNTIGPSALNVLQFKDQLVKQVGIPVSLQDERLSSKEGNNLLIKDNVRRNKRKQVIDKVAATIFLQAFLDKERNK